MSKLRRLVNKREYIRKCVTEEYNCRDSFPSLSSSEQNKLRLQFEQWVSELKEFNEQILSLKYDEWSEGEEECK